MIFLSIIAILLVLGMYTGINYYIGAKGLQLLNSVFPSISPKIYWPIFFLIAFSFIIERFISRFMPQIVSYLFSLVGSYWIAALVYFGIIILIIKLILVFDRWLSFVPSHLKTGHMSNIVSISAAALVILILIIGTWQARNPITVKYDININKDGGNIKNLHAVMVSDIHLGTLVRKGQLDKMVRLINEKNPDIVFIAGDLINDDIKPFLDQNMPESLLKIKSRYGVYYCLGNHEYYGGSSNDIAKALTEAGIKVLRDSYVNIQDSIYVIGREDMGAERHLNHPRAKLSQIISGLDKSKPLILLDHQPSNLKEPAGEGIDLQFSGHTHRGQFFPFNFITNAIFEKDWGYLKKGDFQLIVSSGLGTWGPPIRFLNSTELVEINISFKQNN